MVVEESVHVVFDEFNDLHFKDILRNAGIEKNMNFFKITQESQKIQEEACEKDIQLEVVLPQLETRK